MMTKSALGVAAALILMTTTAPPAEANIVNVQSAMSGDVKPGLTFKLTGSLKWFTGNADIMFLTGSPMATIKAGKHLLLGFGNVAFATSNDTRIIFRTYEHIRYRYKAKKWLTPEVFVQHAFDEFRRLSIRALAGVGPSFKVLDLPTVDLSLGVAYMFEYEKYSQLDVDDGMGGQRECTPADDDPMADPPFICDTNGTQKNHRGSTYLMGSYNLDDRVSIVESLYFQPRLDDFSDFRIMSDTTLKVALTKRVSIANSFVVAYDADPPTGVKELDTRMLASATLTF